MLSFEADGGARRAVVEAKKRHVGGKERRELGSVWLLNKGARPAKRQPKVASRYQILLCTKLEQSKAEEMNQEVRGVEGTDWRTSSLRRAERVRSTSYLT